MATLLTTPGLEISDILALLSPPVYVESPFIIVKIGDVTLGSYIKKDVPNYNLIISNINYPNYLDSIEIYKVNGEVNVYTIKITYAITLGDDPNLFEKIFGSISDSREITISYGDWLSPSFLYQEEPAIITNVKSSVDFANSKITYTLKCVSNSFNLASARFNFPARKSKPSDIIKSMLLDKRFGLYDIFYGMHDINLVNTANLIASDDRLVLIEAKFNESALDYLNYLVSCMQPIESKYIGRTQAANLFTNTFLSNAIYRLCIYDNIKNDFGGPYFRVVKVELNLQLYNSSDTYELDIGYPTNALVVDFNLSSDLEWSILYNYSNEIAPQNYVYTISNDGEISLEFAPNSTISSKYLKTTPAGRSWWSLVTSFPLLATITIKGMLRPAILMRYLKINALFYGNRHVSSGLYIITKQVDSISSSGYRTTLSLVRIGQDYFDDLNISPYNTDYLKRNK